MSLMVEGVVDAGMDVEKTLRGSRRLEPLLAEDDQPLPPALWRIRSYLPKGLSFLQPIFNRPPWWRWRSLGGVPFSSNALLIIA